MRKRQYVYVGTSASTTTASALVSGATNSNAANAVAINEVSIVDKYYNMIDTTVSIPTEFYIVNVDNERGTFYSPLIQKSEWKALKGFAYNIGKNKATRVDGFSTPVIGDMLHMKVIINDAILGQQNNVVVEAFIEMKTTVIATEVARLATELNNALSVHLVQGVQIVQAKAVGNTIIVVQGDVPMPIDNSYSGNLISFTVGLGIAIVGATGVEKPDWTTLHPSIALTPGSIDRSLWSTSTKTYTAFTFSTAQPVAELGTIRMVESAIRTQERGLPAVNDVFRELPDTSYLAGNVYGCIVIETKKSRSTGVTNVEVETSHNVFVKSSAYTAFLTLLTTIVASW